MFQVSDAQVGSVAVKNVVMPPQIPPKKLGMLCVKNGTMLLFHVSDAQVGSVEVKNVDSPPQRLPKKFGISSVKNVSVRPIA